MRVRHVVSALIVTLSVATAARGTATITVLNLDGPGEGFNDPTPAAPVGGNSGTTIGEQGLIAFDRGAELWGALLDSDVEILVGAEFDPLPCAADFVTLGRASTNSVDRNFAGAPIPDTWYPAALANKLAGMDLCPDGSACGDPNNLSVDTFDMSADLQ